MAAKPFVHQFTSPYPPEEFLRRFLPFATGVAGRLGYSLKQQTPDTLIFERQYRPAGFILLFGLLAFGSQRIAPLTFTAQAYAHGSLVTARGQEGRARKAIEAVSIWPAQAGQQPAA